MKYNIYYSGAARYITGGPTRALLEIKLTIPQARFFMSQARYPAFCGGFGSGKSYALFLKMLTDKFTYPDVNLLYAAPTYSLIRDIAFDRLIELLNSCPVRFKLNKAESILEIQNYGKILFRTLDNPDRIVGFEVFRAYLDELDTLKESDAKDAWNKVIGRCRQKSAKTGDNKVFVATTPEGFRYIHTRWVKEPNPEYELIKAPTYSNPHLPQSYIESLRASYPAHLIGAYIEGEFVNLTSQTVYPNFSRTRNNTNITYDNADILHIGMDFNVMNMNAVVHIVREEKVYAVAELVKVDDTRTMVQYLASLFPNHFPKRMIVYPDAYADSKRSADVTSQTDHQILRDAQLKLEAPLANPPIKDRIQTMNLMFLDGNEETRYFVNTRNCPNYTTALEQQVYDQNGMPQKDRNNYYDDINDSAGYFIHQKYSIVRPIFNTTTVKNY